MVNISSSPIEQYSVCLLNLDPTIGHEIKKTRPCAVISPNEMNRYLQTIIIAPMTTKSHKYPTRIEIMFKKKQGWIVLDQLRSVDRKRIIRTMGHLEPDTIHEVKTILKEMLID